MPLSGVYQSLQLLHLEHATNWVFHMAGLAM